MTMENEIQQQTIGTPQCATTSIAKAIEAPKIRELQSQSDLRMVLLWCYAITGLSPKLYPTPTEDAMLLNLISQKYGGYSQEEIRIAFTMAISRELSEDLDINHYGNFSFEYFARIMSAYKIRRDEAVKKMHREKHTYVQPKIELDEYYEKVLVSPYEKMLAGDPYPFSVLDGWMLYDRIYKIIRLTNEERKEYRSHAAKITAAQDGESPEDRQKRITKTAKHLAFKDWIQAKAIEEFDLRQFMSEKIKELKERKL